MVQVVVKQSTQLSPKLKSTGRGVGWRDARRSGSSVPGVVFAEDDMVRRGVLLSGCGEEFRNDCEGRVRD